MLPAALARFLGEASVAFASTRDRSLAPHLHGLSGWQLEEDHATVRCLVAEAFSDHLLESVADNGCFAMVAERIGPHECYQFKGRFVDSGPLLAGDSALRDACATRFATAVRGLYGDRFSVEVLRERLLEPAMAIRFRIEEVYLQTPGPGAGRRVLPEDE